MSVYNMTACVPECVSGSVCVCVCVSVCACVSQDSRLHIFAVFRKSSYAVAPSHEKQISDFGCGLPQVNLQLRRAAGNLVAGCRKSTFSCGVPQAISVSGCRRSSFNCGVPHAISVAGCRKSYVNCGVPQACNVVLCRSPGARTVKRRALSCTAPVHLDC